MRIRKAELSQIRVAESAPPPNDVSKAAKFRMSDWIQRRMAAGKSVSTLNIRPLKGRTKKGKK